jgi:hypothetical protein
MGQAVGSTNIEPMAAFRVVAERVGPSRNNSLKGQSGEREPESACPSGRATESINFWRIHGDPDTWSHTQIRLDWQKASPSIQNRKHLRFRRSSITTYKIYSAPG